MGVAASGVSRNMGVTNMNGCNSFSAILSLTVVLLGAGTVAMAGQTTPLDNPKVNKQPPASNAVDVNAGKRSTAPASKPVAGAQPNVRRPDLKSLPLSDQNSTKPVPYVDVVQSGSGQEDTKEAVVKPKRTRN
jgi:hypothetical protein